MRQRKAYYDEQRNDTLHYDDISTLCTTKVTFFAFSGGTAPSEIEKSDKRNDSLVASGRGDGRFIELYP